MKKFKNNYGVVVPLITPFDQKGALDAVSLQKLLNFIINAGAYPFVLGTTGECMSMPLSQRVQVVEKTAEYVQGRATLYAAISDNAISNTLDLARSFKNAGVDTFVAHLPSYYPLKEGQILDYFNKLADAVPCPLMIYNIPSTTHMSIPLEIVETLSHHPNICGLKDSERSTERMEVLGKRYQGREDFAIMSGWTIKSLFALECGFDGIVPNTANLIPGHFKELFDSFNQGDSVKAKTIQEEINGWANLHQKDRSLGDIFAALKVLLQQKGLCQPHMLAPLSALDQQASVSLLKATELLDSQD